MPVPRHAVARPSLVGTVAALVLLAGCGAPPVAERVTPILLTEQDDAGPAPGPGARPVRLPTPAPAGASDELRDAGATDAGAAGTHEAHDAAAGAADDRESEPGGDRDE